MEDKVISALEFSEVRERLAAQAESAGGKALCAALAPAGTLKEALCRQKDTDLAFTCLSAAAPPPFTEVTDVSPALQRLNLGGSLSSAELYAIARLLTTAKKGKEYLDRCAETFGTEAAPFLADAGGYSTAVEYNPNLPAEVQFSRAETFGTEAVPFLADVGEYSTAVEYRPGSPAENEPGLAGCYGALSPLPQLCAALCAALPAPEEVADAASGKLGQLRREKQRALLNLQEQLHRLVGKNSKMLQDNIVTVRDGRYCLPVKAEYRADFAGILHGQSGSGATVFMEPAGVVAANNRIRELEGQEELEIERILAELSARAAEHAGEIAADLTALTTLDFIFAKAKLARAMRATKPVLTLPAPTVAGNSKEKQESAPPPVGSGTEPPAGKSAPLSGSGTEPPAGKSAPLSGSGTKSPAAAPPPVGSGTESPAGKSADTQSAAPILLKQARHPLIPENVVVPIDLTLGGATLLLVVTGPNTGGKTVSLKTLGLLTLMAESGLFIPAEQGSRLTFFTGVYCDIGDEQSIAQSLSTFSGHMRAIVSIIERADQNSLILLDELCAGTDPTEGAALAIAILEHLKNKGCTVMATTHYSELKIYALETPGVKNASLAFDEATLSPTYRLLIGMPGKSNAFAIAKKLGLGKCITDAARERMPEGQKDFADVVAELENTRAELEKEKQEAKKAREAATEREQALRQKQEKEEKQREALLQKAKKEAESMVAQAKAYTDETIRTVNRLKRSGDVKQLEQTRTKLRGKMQENAQEKEPKGGAKEPAQSAGTFAGRQAELKNLKIGDSVHVHSLNADAEIATLPNASGELFVQAGLLRTKVNVKDLTLNPKPKPAEKPQNRGISAITRERAATTRTEVNLIGMNTEEAAAALSQFLDDAYLAGRDTVTVVHGRGTGALRNAVHGVLKKTKYVKSFRLGEFGEGDTGVTVVSFKS